MKKVSIFMFFLLPGLILSCSRVEEHEETKHAEWGYTGEVSPDHWNELDPEFVACAEGHFQSPIDIETLSAEPIDWSHLRFNYHPSFVEEVNNGHSIQVELKEKNQLFIDEKEYTLQQFHFHEPSEHRIDGIIYPMEIHLVHQDSLGHLVVIGIFAKEGPENEYLKELWSTFPDHVNEHKEPEHKCYLTKILPEEKSGFHYSGSLTTPPCTEGVDWYVMDEPITLSKDQISKFKDLYHNNNRPVQEHE